MNKLLIIDDDAELCELLTEYFTEADFETAYALEAEAGLALASQQPWDIIILDVMLPGGSGLSVLQTLRAQQATQHTPVLMLSAKGEEIDRVLGLEMGADDYLSKPFSARELMARVRALLRRAAPAKNEQDPLPHITKGDLRLWPGALQMAVGNNPKTNISAMELRLLEELTEAPGTVVTREQLYRNVLGLAGFHPFDRRLDMVVSRLRRKLGPRADGEERIRAVRGEGYVYLVSGESA